MQWHFSSRVVNDFCHAKPQAPDLSAAGLEHVCWRSIFCALPVHISCVRDLDIRFQKLLQWHFSSRVVNDFCHAKPRAPDLSAAGLELVCWRSIFCALPNMVNVSPWHYRIICNILGLNFFVIAFNTNVLFT